MIVNSKQVVACPDKIMYLKQYTACPGTRSPILHSHFVKNTDWCWNRPSLLGEVYMLTTEAFRLVDKKILPMRRIKFTCVKYILWSSKFYTHEFNMVHGQYFLSANLKCNDFCSCCQVCDCGVSWTTTRLCGQMQCSKYNSCAKNNSSLIQLSDQLR